MDCTEIIEMLPEYVVGALDRPAVAQVQAHLGQCADCRRELAALERTGDLLAPIEMLDAPPDLWRAIRARLEPRRARRPVWQAHWKPVLAAAAAAAMLVAVLLGWPLMHVPTAVDPEFPVLAGVEGAMYADIQIVAAWEQPFANEASLALAMAVMDPQDSSSFPQGGIVE